MVVKAFAYPSNKIVSTERNTVPPPEPPVSSPRLPPPLPRSRGAVKSPYGVPVGSSGYPGIMEYPKILLK